MIVIVAVVLGAYLGVRKARQRGGERLDLLQYGVGYAIAFGLVATIATLLLDRLVF